VTRNADTLAAERYIRTAKKVTGELVIGGAGIRQTYEMTVNPSGTVSRFETSAYRTTAPTEALQTVVARFDDTGAMIEAGGQTTPHATPAGTIPFINLSAAVVEQILMRAKAIGGTAADVPVLVMAGGQNTTAGVRWLGADSALITLGPELRVEVSPSGQLLGGVVPSQGVHFVRGAPRGAVSRRGGQGAQRGGLGHSGWNAHASPGLVRYQGPSGRVDHRLRLSGSRRSFARPAWLAPFPADRRHVEPSWHRGAQAR
jgi:hypothetical protein